MVVAAAGSLEHERIVELAGAVHGAGAPAIRPRPTPPSPTPARDCCFYPKETEQYHICFGAPGIARDDERRLTLGVLDAIFGGSTSSRLFREIREKRGLAYSVGSYADQYVDRGMVAMYVGTREENVDEACEIIGRELDLLRGEGVERRRARPGQGARQGPDGARARVDPGRMSRNARSALFGLPFLTHRRDHREGRRDHREDVIELARELYAPERLSAACIGAEEDRFRGAVDAGQRSPGRLSGRLASGPGRRLCSRRRHRNPPGNRG